MRDPGLWVWKEDGTGTGTGDMHPATAKDVLSWLREHGMYAITSDLIAGVESGTIEGERVCLEHRAWFCPEDRSTVCSLYSWLRLNQRQPSDCRIAVAAVIPVSDGGSET